jgi:hypothetical protein
MSTEGASGGGSGRERYAVRTKGWLRFERNLDGRRVACAVSDTELSQASEEGDLRVPAGTEAGDLHQIPDAMRMRDEKYQNDNASGLRPT